MTKPQVQQAAAARDKASGPRLQLLYLVKRWYVAAKARLDEITREHDLTTGEYTMLSFLKRLEPCSAADLSREQKITSQAVTQQVAQLKAKGMVTSALNAANRRISLISLTERGRESLVAMNAQARRLEKQMMAGLAADEQEAIRTFLLRSIEAVENSDWGPEADDE